LPSLSPYSVAASLIFGLAPALQASGRDPQTVLRQGGTRGVLGGAMGRLRSGLVVTEVALSVILMISAGLLIRSFAALNDVDLGFHADHLLVAAFDVPSADTRRAQQDFYAPLVQRLKRSPGVVSAAAVLGLPTSAQSGSNGTYSIDGLELPNFTPNAPQAGFTAASPSYFTTLGTRIVAGRDFDQRDTFEAPSVAIVSQALAQKSFPHENPMGRKILCGWDRRTMQSMTIVGIAADMRNNGPAEAPSPEIYVPYQQHPHSNMDVVVRTSADPAAMTNTIQRIAHEINPEAPMRSTTMQEDLSQAMDSQRFRSLLLGLFAGLAVCLAMAGIYGVTSYAVSQRTAEIGLRMALGADRKDILRMVFGQVFRLAIIGLFLGAVGAALSTRLIRAMLFSVTPSDPITYLVIVGSLALITVLAGIIPAVRAAHVEPLDALGQE
jgi:putative ABC transport system permease protein